MDGVPSVIWSGNGYHIYQPVEAFILEEQQIFNGLDQPSRHFRLPVCRAVPDKWENGRMSQPYHVAQELYASCTRTGSLNSKSNPPKPVKVIQTWDGNRPDIKPLLQGCYIYLQALRLKKNTEGTTARQSICQSTTRIYTIKPEVDSANIGGGGKDIDTNRKM